MPKAINNSFDVYTEYNRLAWWQKGISKSLSCIMVLFCQNYEASLKTWVGRFRKIEKSEESKLANLVDKTDSTATQIKPPAEPPKEVSVKQPIETPSPINSTVTQSKPTAEPKQPRPRHISYEDLLFNMPSPSQPYTPPSIPQLNIPYFDPYTDPQDLLESKPVHPLTDDQASIISTKMENFFHQYLQNHFSSKNSSDLNSAFHILCSNYPFRTGINEIFRMNSYHIPKNYRGVKFELNTIIENSISLSGHGNPYYIRNGLKDFQADHSTFAVVFTLKKITFTDEGRILHLNVQTQEKASVIQQENFTLIQKFIKD
jgi:hypothetical protein